jgi:hypothetical protein
VSLDSDERIVLLADISSRVRRHYTKDTETSTKDKTRCPCDWFAVPVNFQVLRRTFATNAQTPGNAKDVQTHLRHTDIATTLGVYTQPIDESVRKLVNAVAEDVMSAEELQAQVVTTPIQ